MTLVDFILHLKKTETPISPTVTNNLIAKQLEGIIDGMVLELYFEEEMTAKKINIIALVEAELQKVNSPTIEDSIYKLYQAVQHPTSEIRNRIANFATASPSILKLILEG